MKKRFIAIIVLLLAVFLSYSDTTEIHITGKVTDSVLQVVPSAVVTLANARISDTVNADGTFVLKGNITHIIKEGVGSNHSEYPVLQRDLVIFTIANNKNVSINIYNLLGKKIASVFEGALKRGGYKIGLFRNCSINPANGTYVISVKIDSKSSYLKYNHIGGPIPNRQGALFPSIKNTNIVTANTPIHQEAVIDTLIICKNNYFTKYLLLKKYVQNVGNIVIFEFPEYSNSDNIGNDRIIIIPKGNEYQNSQVNVEEYTGPYKTLYDNDSILKPPVKITLSDTIVDSSGLIVKIPLNDFTPGSLNDVNTFAQIIVDTFSISLHGYLKNDTLIFSIPRLYNEFLLLPIYNAGMDFTFYEDTGSISAHTKDGSKSWPSFSFWCYYNKHDPKLRAVISNYLGHTASDAEIENHISRYVTMNASKIARIFSRQYKLASPSLPVHLKYKKKYNKIFYEIALHEHPSRAVTSLFSDFGMYIEYGALDNIALNSPDHLGGSIKNHIAHEMMHTIINNYRIINVFSDGLHEGIATTIGHTIDNNIENNTGIFVRPGSLENYQMDQSLLGFSNSNTMYGNHDFFAYVGKKFYPKIELQYVSELLNSIGKSVTLITNQVEYLKLMDSYFNTSLGRDLNGLYTLFIVQRSYLHEKESKLRPSDTHKPSVLRSDLFSSNNPVREIKHGSATSSTVFTGIPSYSTRCAKVIFTKKNGYYIKISCNNLTTTGGKELDIRSFFDGTFWGVDEIYVDSRKNDSIVMLILNKSYKMANNVKVELKPLNHNYTIIPSEDSGYIPFGTSFSAKAAEPFAISDDAQWVWRFGDGNSKTTFGCVHSVDHMYEEVGEYNVSVSLTNFGKNYGFSMPGSIKVLADTLISSSDVSRF